MDSTIDNHTSDMITDRCMRCYKEQQWYGENFLYDYVGDSDIKGKFFLEIGCAEGGLLKFYQKKGAFCSGLELSDVRFKNALLLDKEDSLNLFQADICKPETYTGKFKEKYDTIIIRDVIEHIDDKKTALMNIFQILKPGGKLFMSFPPKYCAYAGHQQTVPKLFGKIPYLHLLPNNLYKGYLKAIRCPKNKIKYLISTKKTRISINSMKKLVNSIGFNIVKEDNWLIRPAYSFRFGLPKIKNPLSWLPILDEVLCNGMLYLLRKPEK